MKITEVSLLCMTHSSKRLDKVDLIFDWPCILLMPVSAKRKKATWGQSALYTWLWTNFYLCNTFTQNQTHSVSDCNAVCCSKTCMLLCQGPAGAARAQPYIAWINQYYWWCYRSKLNSLGVKISLFMNRATAVADKGNWESTWVKKI